MEDILKILLVVALFAFIPRWIWGQKTKQKIALLKQKGIENEKVKGYWIHLISFYNKNLGSDFARIPVWVDTADRIIFEYLFVYAESEGTPVFSPEEIHNLQEYTEAGGFLQIHNTVGKSEDFSPVLSKLFPQEKQIKIGWEHPIFNQSYKFPEDFPCLQQLYKNAPPVWGIIKEERLCIFYEEFKTEAVQKQNSETFNIQPVSEEIRKIEANIVNYAFSN